MLNILLTLIPIVALLVVIFFSINLKKKENNALLDLNQTSFLKAFSCIIIVYVHIPLAFSNSLQDLIGSFAGVGVMLFFLFSSFGTLTQYNKNKTMSFFVTFWIKRLTALFITALVINVINFVWCGADGSGWSIINIVKFNRYIYAILAGYLIIFIALMIDYLLKSKKSLLIYICLACFLLASSLITFFTKFDIFQLWAVESLGLTVGVIMFILKPQIESLLGKTKPYVLTLCVLFVIAGTSSLIYLLKKDDSFLMAFLIRGIMFWSIGSLLIAATHKIDISKKPIHILGSASYGVYLLHLVVIDRLLLIFPEGQSGLFILTVFLITVSGAILISYCVKPLNNLIRKWCKSIDLALSKK